MKTPSPDKGILIPGLKESSPIFMRLQQHAKKRERIHKGQHSGDQWKPPWRFRVVFVFERNQAILSICREAKQVAWVSRVAENEAR